MTVLSRVSWRMKNLAPMKILVSTIITAAANNTQDLVCMAIPFEILGSRLNGNKK